MSKKTMDCPTLDKDLKNLLNSGKVNWVKPV